MTLPYPPGFSFDREGVDAARITLRIGALLREHRVNALVDLPPEPFQEAMRLQSHLDVLKARQKAKLTERLARGREKSRVTTKLKQAARFENFRKVVEARGGPAAVNKLGLSRELGIGRSTVRDYLKRMERQAAADGPRCLACGQPVHIDRIPTVHDDDTNDASPEARRPTT